ncbi:N-acetyltransferase [Pedobacter yulinensis]|uniref:N-acetyltransferase n=1 Tax=Pedobacter yulinensis TaxID=2126353 RepID=A0A2T3HHH4_9SPHI|nr:GNAT family N-acetyltransferase [Pedobacter yulinensis]PST81887.1 N-acetyltransferase [Pedobacter yulinensis]
MVKFIPAEDTLPLRSLVLRNGKPRELCVFPADEAPGSFHLGCLKEGHIVSVASFFPAQLHAFEGMGYQLRGMATHPQQSGRGYGAALLDFAASHLAALGIDYLWCNARAAAVGFYTKTGFEVVSAVFDVPQIGPHYEMKLNLK